MSARTTGLRPLLLLLPSLQTWEEQHQGSQRAEGADALPQVNAKALGVPELIIQVSGKASTFS